MAKEIFPKKSPPLEAPTGASSAVTAGLAQWTCTIDGTPKDEKGFTVGEKFGIECGGASAALKEPLQFEMPENQDFVIHLLKVTSLSDNQLKGEATSYRPGDHKLQNVKLVDGEGHSVTVASIQHKVASVLTAESPKEPYGPIPGIKMEWPMWPFFTLAVVLAVFIAWILVFTRRRVQKRLLEKNIRKFQSPLGSYHQFSKDLRGIKRGVIFSTHREWEPGQVIDFLNKLDESYRLFILREFIVPATTWKENLILREIKRKDRGGFDKYKNLLIRAFRELRRAKAHPEDLKSADCEQLAQITWQAVDLIWKTKKESQNTKGEHA